MVSQTLRLTSTATSPKIQKITHDNISKKKLRLLTKGTLAGSLGLHLLELGLLLLLLGLESKVLLWNDESNKRVGGQHYSHLCFLTV